MMRVAIEIVAVGGKDVASEDSHGVIEISSDRDNPTSRVRLHIAGHPSVTVRVQELIEGAKLCSRIF